MISDDLAGWQQGAFIASLVVILISLTWNIWLFRVARRSESRSEPGQDVSPMSADDFTWVFLVPALNEEVTIADSVQRLLDVRCTRRHIVVIDDGSADRTPAVLAGISSPDLTVLRRNAPDAQLGKADALNDAWRRLPALIEARDGRPVDADRGPWPWRCPDGWRYADRR